MKLISLLVFLSPTPSHSATTITITTKATATSTSKPAEPAAKEGLVIDSCEAEEYAPKNDPDYPEYRFFRAKFTLRNAGKAPVEKGTTVWHGHQLEGGCDGGGGTIQTAKLEADLGPGETLSVTGGAIFNSPFDGYHKRLHYWVTTEEKHNDYLSLTGKNCSWDGRAKAKDPDTFLVCKLKLLK